MDFVVLIESLVILVTIVLIWRRTRPSDPLRLTPLIWAALAVAAQGALLVVINVVMENLENAPADASGQLVKTAWILWAIQAARAALCIAALSFWLRVAKPRLVRSWRGIVLGIALLLTILVPDVPVIGPLLVFIVLGRLKWTSDVHGWRRAAGFIVALILLVMSLTTVTTGYQDEHASETGIHIISGGPTIGLLGDPPPRSVAAINRATTTWETVIRSSYLLIRWQLVIVFFRFLVFPIRLRGLSLKRRFTVTMILYRVIPGLLGFAAVVLGVYFGIGLHKTRLAQEAFVETLDQNLKAGDVILEGVNGWPDSVDDVSVERHFAEAQRWMERDGTNTHCVLKQVRLRYGTPDSTGAREAHVDSVLRTTSTPGTPEHFITSSLFDAGAVDTVTGMTVADTVLYLASARAVRETEGADLAVVAEVYTVVDTVYISHIAHLVGADVRFRAIPDMFLGDTRLTVNSDTTWADSSFMVSASPSGPSSKSGFWYDNHFLARAFVPLSDWRTSISHDLSGAADLRLEISPDRLVHGMFSNMLVFSSNAVAIAIFATILLLFMIAEYSAARTGRSIIKGILDDVKGLAEAASRFGKGDLSHRIGVRGKDELGSLSASFNTMAENIEENQELLLEKERLEADLSLARDIQQRMLPQSPPVLPGLDVAGLSIPSREVGGDLFYFLPVSDGRLGLTIGDVSGKSVPAALLMSNVLAALKTEARLVENEDEILSHLNSLIVEQVEPGKFVTFFYGVIDRRNSKLDYACAGHNPALLMKLTGKAIWLSEAGLPLGVLPETEYVSCEVPLERGDVLVLYSDGVTEAERLAPAADKPPVDRTTDKPDAGSDEQEQTDFLEPEFFDDHRLEEAVRDARSRSAAEIVTAVVNSVTEFTEGADLSDDLTLVVVKII